MTTSDRHHLGEALDRLAATHSDQIRVRPPTGHESTPPRRGRLVAAALVAATVVGAVAWLTRGAETDIDVAAHTAEDAEPQRRLVFTTVFADGGPAGTTAVGLDLGGPLPDPEIAVVGSFEEVRTDRISLFAQLPPAGIRMCDSTHGWGTPDPSGVLGLTLPGEWFAPGLAVVAR